MNKTRSLYAEIGEINLEYGSSSSCLVSWKKCLDNVSSLSWTGVLIRWKCERSAHNPHHVLYKMITAFKMSDLRHVVLYTFFSQKFDHSSILHYQVIGWFEPKLFIVLGGFYFHKWTISLWFIILISCDDIFFTSGNSFTILCLLIIFSSMTWCFRYSFYIFLSFFLLSVQNGWLAPNFLSINWTRIQSHTGRLLFDLNPNSSSCWEDFISTNESQFSGSSS